VPATLDADNWFAPYVEGARSSIRSTLAVPPRPASPAYDPAARRPQAATREAVTPLAAVP